MNLPHVVLSLLVVAGVAYLMVLAGTGKRALEPRRGTRTCPSCGRSVRDCRCID